MADTIQVVRIDTALETRVVSGRMEFWYEDERRWFDLGGVIERTEQRARRHTEGVGWERRLISEWEAVDAAG